MANQKTARLAAKANRGTSAEPELSTKDGLHRETSGDAHEDERSTRARILDAAERLFAERGFDRTSTARIATEASVPHGLIFYYFKTKMDLLLAVTEGYAASTLDELRLPNPAQVEPFRAISDLWTNLSRVLGQPNTVSRILFQELSAHPEIREQSAEAHGQIVAAICDYLVAACGQGVRVAECDTAARLMAIAAAIAPMLNQSGEDALTPDAVAAVITRGLIERKA